MQSAGLGLQHVTSYGAYVVADFYVITGDYGQSFLIGTYEGANYIENEYQINSWLFKMNNDLTVSTDRTKDGYFTVDTSSFTPGLWSISYSDCVFIVK